MDDADDTVQMEEMIQEKVTQKENELNATYDEKMRNYEERYAGDFVSWPPFSHGCREQDLQRQLALTKSQLRDLRTSNESNQAKLLDHTQRQGRLHADRLDVTTKETPLKTRRSSPNLLSSTWSSPTLSRPTVVSRPSSDETYGSPSLASDRVVDKQSHSQELLRSEIEALRSGSQLAYRSVLVHSIH